MQIRLRFHTLWWSVYSRRDADQTEVSHTVVVSVQQGGTLLGPLLCCHGDFIIV